MELEVKQMKRTFQQVKRTIPIQSVNPIVFPKGGIVFAP